MSKLILATFSILVVATASLPSHIIPYEKGCNGEDGGPGWEHLRTGISCCEEGFTIGDNEGYSHLEKFIQPDEYDTSCWKSCQKLYPNYRGMTESLKQTYSSGAGKNQKKCWCEYSDLNYSGQQRGFNAENKDYQTCIFMEELQKKACTSYHPLTDAWRRIDSTTTAKERNCDYDSGSRSSDLKARNLFWSSAWYRFMGPAGSKLPEGPSNGTRKCGSNTSAYLSKHVVLPAWGSDHPTIRDGIIKRSLCFESSSSDNCQGTSNWRQELGFSEDLIEIAACLEDGEEYFVYRLGPLHNGHNEFGCLGYCAVE